MSDKKEEVFISAAPGSRRFDKISEAVGGAESHIASYKIAATINGEERTEDLGQYTKQKFLDSRQSTMPHWDLDAASYIFKRADGSIYTQDDLNKLVEEVPQHYKYGPKAGERIMTSNLRYFGDAYITRFRRELFEGDDRLDPNSPSEKVYEDMMRGNRRFMDEAMDDVMSSEVEFIIRNPQMAEDREVSLRENKELAFDYYNGMKTDPDRMRKILLLYGVDSPENASTQSLRNQLFKKVDDNITREGGDTYQKLFCMFAEYLPDELDLRAFVTKASIRRIIVDRAGIYEFEGLTLGGTFEAVLDYFRQGNTSVKEAINIRMDSSK